MQTLFESQTNMAFPWYWPEDEQLMTPITLGPYHPSEVAYAECLSEFFISLPTHIQSKLLAVVRPGVKALVHFMCADRSMGEVRMRHQRRGLRELGFRVVYQI